MSRKLRKLEQSVTTEGPSRWIAFAAWERLFLPPSAGRQRDNLRKHQEATIHSELASGASTNDGGVSGRRYVRPTPICNHKPQTHHLLLLPLFHHIPPKTITL